SEAALAQFALGSGGFNADQIHQSLGGTLQLAEAGKVDLERAAQIAVGTLNGFGLAAEKINHVNDVFLKGTNLTATSVDGLGETMKYVAPIAKAAGSSIEQATAMTGLLGNNNILDTQAGTSLRSIFTRFAGPPKEAEKAFKKLGIQTKDSRGNMRDISTVLAEVNQATKKMGNGVRLDIFKDIAGQEAISAFAVLVDQSALMDKNSGKAVNKIKELTKELEKSEGAAARAAKILKENLAGDIEQLGGSVQDLSISLLNALGTDLTNFVRGLGGIIDRIKTWVEANPKLVRTIADIVIKLLIFKVAMLSLTYTGSLLLGSIFSIVAGITKLALVMWLLHKISSRIGINLPSKFAIIARATRLLGQAFIFLSRQALPLLILGLRTLTIALLTNPFTWIIAAVALVALMIWKYWSPIKAFFLGFWDGLTIGLSPLIDAVSTSFNQLKNTLSPLLPIWNAIKTVFGWVAGVISSLFTPFQATNQQLEKAKSNGLQLGQAFGIFLGVIGSIILKIIEFASLLLNVIGTAIGTFVAMIVVNIGKIPEFIKNLWSSLKGFFDSGIANISATILNWSPMGLFYSVFASVLSWFGIDLPTKFTGFGGMMIDGLINGIKSTFPKLKETWNNVADYMPDWLQKRMEIRSPSRVMAGLGGHIVGGISVGLDNASPSLKKKYDDVISIFNISSSQPTVKNNETVPITNNFAQVKPIAVQTDRNAFAVAGDTYQITIQATPGQATAGLERQIEQVILRLQNDKMSRIRSSMLDQE
ncbi:phage tail tape measure protein, partial [Acinetobacter sp. B5B]|uniref:phage tail tape measure protein n=1 Tax=Acinetobacter baretiae TaxID=2605383 RepID=UPI0018C1FB6E